MPYIMPKLPLVHALPVQPAIFFAALPVLAVWLGAVLALARCGRQWFARHAGFTLAFLTRHSSGSASPPTEFQR